MPVAPGRPRGREGAELAAALAGRVRDEVRFLADRLIPEAGLKTDLIAISPAAVWVVEARRLEGEAHVCRRGDRQELRVGLTDLTDHVPALLRRVELVSAAVESLAPGVPTIGAFCFHRAELPVIRTLTISGLPLCDAEAVAKRLNVRGPVDELSAVRLNRDLGLRFPAC
jgi:hypothetical protein